ncbi:MAG: hypothetical protein ACRBM6_14635 [Geminicoccales bacterium]
MVESHRDEIILFPASGGGEPIYVWGHPFSIATAYKMFDAYSITEPSAWHQVAVE